MKEEYDTYAYFWVGSFKCNPEEISELLNLKPTRILIKGDLISNRSEKRRKESSWQYYSSLPRTEIFQDAHIENILKAIYSKKQEILKLGSEYEVGINCVGYYSNVNPGFHMSAELIKKCAELNLSIDFDLYA